MTYATLMVHLQVGPSNAPVLAVTRQLAKRFGVAVISITATQAKHHRHNLKCVTAQTHRSLAAQA